MILNVSSIICSALQIITDDAASVITGILSKFLSSRYLSLSGSYPLDLSCLGDPVGSNVTTGSAPRVTGTHKPVHPKSYVYTHSFFPRFWRVRSKPARRECQCKCSACRDTWSAVFFHVPGVQVWTFQLGGNSTRRSNTYTNWTIRAKPAGLARRPVLTTFSITRWHYGPALRSSAELRIDTPNPRGWRIRVNGANKVEGGDTIWGVSYIDQS
jgi:hypothetical protein